MGTFTVLIAFGNIDGGDLREVEVLVDTGATHTVLPDDMLRQMSIEPKDHSHDRLRQWGKRNMAYRRGQNCLCRSRMDVSGAILSP